MPDTFLDALSVEEETARWQRAIAQSAARARPVLVVEDERGKVAGYAVVGADVDDAAQGLLFLMYVAPECWGTGVGRALMEASIERLREAGFGRAVLWVLEANARARRFYERAGWVEDGGRSMSTYDGVALEALRYGMGLPPEADVG
jgi:GNAT superfamily N-acetyltransferase